MNDRKNALSGSVAPGSPRSLAHLLTDVSGVSVEGAATDIRIAGIRSSSHEIRPGDLFVALKGVSRDGHAHLREAVERGAAALVVEGDAPVPEGSAVVRVTSTRRALAELASAWYGHPARDLLLAGITGTVGKTSVLALLESIMIETRAGVGSLGSLGVHLDGRILEETGYTAPEPVLLHRELARLRDEGCALVVMEVTSHALAQQRVHGLSYRLGIFTNLLPLEHQDYHHSFEEYVEAKSRFFDHLAEKAPLIYNADDPGVSGLVTTRQLVTVPCGSDAAAVRIGGFQVTAEGTRMRLAVEKPLVKLDGSRLEPLRIDIRTRVLGRSNLYNAALAAAAALLLGAKPSTIQHALAAFPPPRRRVEIIHSGRFAVVDDTVGHPESITALFEVVQALRPRKIHIAITVRGNRGPEINQQTAEAIAIWAEKIPPATLVVTRAEDTADERNRVSEEESEAFTGPLTRAELPFSVTSRLEEAIDLTMDSAGDRDLVLLMGAQAMDRGAEIARRWLGTHNESRSSSGEA